MSDDSVVLGQCPDAPVVSRFRLGREEAAGDSLVMITVVRDALTAFSVAGAVKCAGAGSGVFAAHGFLLFLAGRAGMIYL